MGRDELGPRFRAALPDGLVGQGISAELIAAQWDLSREDLDALSVASHRRAARARDAGLLARDIVPVEVGGRVVTTDEGIRDTTTAEVLAGLRASFERPEISARFPQIRWRVTAGNSSQLTDGAAAALVVSERALTAHGLTPRARVVATSAVGDEPVMMLTGVIPATTKVLARSGLGVDQMDTVEINEAFASVVLAWAAEFPVRPRAAQPVGRRHRLRPPGRCLRRPAARPAGRPAGGDPRPLRPVVDVRVRRDGERDGPRARVAQRTIEPPSIGIVWPCMKSASSLAR